MIGQVGGPSQGIGAYSSLQQQTNVQKKNQEEESFKVSEEGKAGESVDDGLRVGGDGNTLSAGVSQSFGTDSENYDPSTPRGTLVNLFA